MSSVKYRHPLNVDLKWSGRGKAPKWYDYALENGFTEEALLIENQATNAQAAEIDLGIGETPAAVEPTFAEKLYGERIAAGLHPLPEVGDLSFTPGVRQVVEAATTPVPVEAPESSRQQLEICLREFGFQSLTAEEFLQAGIEELNQATIRACRAGVAFWAAQEAVKNAESAERTPDFKDWIESAGLTKQRVYECIAIAKFYARLPDAMRSKALSIGKKNTLLLASLPQEVIDQAAESGNDLIGKADMMTVAELKEEIKALQRREKNYEAELERATSQVKRLSEAKKRTTDFLLRTEELREECMALQMGAELHLNSLRKLFEETDPQAPEGTLQMEHLWVVANTLAARSLDLLEFMRARVPDGMPDRPMTKHCLTPDEAIRWLQDYPLIENRFAAEAAVRESRREAARPRGPGRPSGSKNKGTEE